MQDSSDGPALTELALHEKKQIGGKESNHEIQPVYNGKPRINWLKPQPKQLAEQPYDPKDDESTKETNKETYQDSQISSTSQPAETLASENPNSPTDSTRTSIQEPTSSNQPLKSSDLSDDWSSSDLSSSDSEDERPSGKIIVNLGGMEMPKQLMMRCRVSLTLLNIQVPDYLLLSSSDESYSEFSDSETESVITVRSEQNKNGQYGPRSQQRVIGMIRSAAAIERIKLEEQSDEVEQLDLMELFKQCGSCRVIVADIRAHTKRYDHLIVDYNSTTTKPSHTEHSDSDNEHKEKEHRHKKKKKHKHKKHRIHVVSAEEVERPSKTKSGKKAKSEKNRKRVKIEDSSDEEVVSKKKIDENNQEKAHNRMEKVKQLAAKIGKPAEPEPTTPPHTISNNTNQPRSSPGHRFVTPWSEAIATFGMPKIPKIRKDANSGGYDKNRHGFERPDRNNPYERIVKREARRREFERQYSTNKYQSRNDPFKVPDRSQRDGRSAHGIQTSSSSQSPANTLINLDAIKPLLDKITGADKKPLICGVPPPAVIPGERPKPANIPSLLDANFTIPEALVPFSKEVKLNKKETITLLPDPGPPDPDIIKPLLATPSDTPPETKALISTPPDYKPLISTPPENKPLISTVPRTKPLIDSPPETTDSKPLISTPPTSNAVKPLISTPPEPSTHSKMTPLLPDPSDKPTGSGLLPTPERPEERADKFDAFDWSIVSNPFGQEKKRDSRFKDKNDYESSDRKRHRRDRKERWEKEDRDRRSDRHSHRSSDKDRDRDKHRDRDRDRHREKDRDRDRDGDRDRDRDRHSDRDRQSEREREREPDKEPEKTAKPHSKIIDQIAQISLEISKRLAAQTTEPGEIVDTPSDDQPTEPQEPAENQTEAQLEHIPDQTEAPLPPQPPPPEVEEPPPEPKLPVLIPPPMPLPLIKPPPQKEPPPVQKKEERPSSKKSEEYEEGEITVEDEILEFSARFERLKEPNFSLEDYQREDKFRQLAAGHVMDYPHTEDKQYKGTANERSPPTRVYQDPVDGQFAETSARADLMDQLEPHDMERQPFERPPMEQHPVEHEPIVERYDAERPDQPISQSERSFQAAESAIKRLTTGGGYTEVQEVQPDYTDSQDSLDYKFYEQQSMQSRRDYIEATQRARLGHTRYEDQDIDQEFDVQPSRSIHHEERDILPPPHDPARRYSMRHDPVTGRYEVALRNYDMTLREREIALQERERMADNENDLLHEYMQERHAERYRMDRVERAALYRREEYYRRERPTVLPSPDPYRVPGGSRYAEDYPTSSRVPLSDPYQPRRTTQYEEPEPIVRDRYGMPIVNTQTTRRYYY